jgi:hypothetical protein
MRYKLQMFLSYQKQFLLVYLWCDVFQKHETLVDSTRLVSQARVVQDDMQKCCWD